jgi:hypothetical protein
MVAYIVMSTVLSMSEPDSLHNIDLSDWTTEIDDVVQPNIEDEIIMMLVDAINSSAKEKTTSGA